MTEVVYLMRHGAVENPAFIRYGQLPGFRLSARGRDQARRAADYLRRLPRPIEEIVASPLERAVETATIVQDELDLPPIATDDRLIEAPSEFDGLHKLAFLEPRHWRKLRNPFRPSWGEPFRDVAARMQDAVADLRARAHGPLLIVTHQSPIWITRQAYRHRPPWTSPMRCEPASITTIRFEHGNPVADTYWAP